MLQAETLILIGLIILAIIILSKSAKVVPQKTVYIVERLGKYSGTLEAGFHILIPFIDRIRYIHSLKENAIDVPEQSCITKDNIQVDIDGILYFVIVDPVKASYGINDYAFASIQLAQTTMRSEVGKIDLDKTFEEREKINMEIVAAVDKASMPWGLKVTRYEIKNIVPPPSIKDAMEKQMRAEREKRALIAESEGDKQAKINRAEGDKQEAIAKSEGEKMKRINEAEGRAQEIERVAQATARGIREIASAIAAPGGSQAVNLRIAEQYLGEFGKLATKSNTMIIPANMTDVASTVATVARIFSQTNKEMNEPPKEM
ncbi:MAG TPA: stomatin-like protein [bacterium]|nr:stomatin-like protein [bacterium]